jgi:hypothetical protein
MDDASQDDARIDAQIDNAFDEYLAAIREYLHKGWVDYFNGVNARQNPYVAGTVPAQCWARGWHAASNYRSTH